MTPQGKTGLDALLLREHPQLLETSDRALGERLVGEVQERGTPPQPDRFAQDDRRAFCIAPGEQSSPLADLVLEPDRVDLDDARVEHVPGRARHQCRAYSLAKARDVDMEQVLRTARWCVTPELVDEAVRRDHLTNVNGQHSKKRPRSRAAQLEDAAARANLE